MRESTHSNHFDSSELNETGYQSEDENFNTQLIENNKNYVALESEIYMISNRAAAAISNAALIVFGIITFSESDHIVDHKKVWRARQKIRESLNTQPVIEDHYVLLGEPNGIYLTHFVVEKGTGSNILRKNE